MQTIDALVHIKESVDSMTLEAVEDDIRNSPGVLATSHCKDTPHLVQVVYDSDQTQLAAIVENFRQHGLHANGVGL